MAWATGQVVGGIVGGAVAERRRLRGAERRGRRGPAPHRRLRAAPRAARRRPRRRRPGSRAGGYLGWADGRVAQLGGGPGLPARGSWSARATATSWPRRSPRPPPAGGRSASPARGHSFTEAAMTDGTMIDVGALSGVIDADPARAWSRSAGGTVLADLNEQLHRLGLAMENLGDIDRQTIAGSISTGTHGTGARLRNISSQVDGDRAGPRRRQRPRAGRATADLLRAARVGVGALGAISAVTLRCVPAFTLDRVDSSAAARGGPRLLPGARRRPRPLRALHLPLRRLGAGPRAQPHRRARRGPAAGSPPSSTTSSSRTGRWRRSRPPARLFPAAIPRLLAARRARSPPAAGRSTAATGSSPTSAASASPRWSTGSRARTAPRRRGG